MKYLPILLLLLLPFTAGSQCQAITINSFILRPLGSCKYVIEINATLTHGNASMKPFYTCEGDEEGDDDDETINLSNCFTWETPSTKSFVSDTFVCCESLLVGLRGYSSSNCHGNKCIEIPLSNLALKDSFPPKTIIPKPKDGLEYNPITRRLTIKGDLDNLRPRELILYTPQGIEIWRETVKSNPILLPQSTGIHFVVVTTARGNLIKTIIL